jgi:lipid-binding SYLF domain-containing protein
MQTLAVLRFFLLIHVVITFGGCAAQQQKGVTKVGNSAAIQDALIPFQKETNLVSFFDNAVAIAIIPKAVRAGTGFGGAFGRGWLIEGDDIVGRVIHWQFLAGADLGAQMYSQIIFFKTKDSVQQFREQAFQFGGQANATAGAWGKGWTPAYNSEVAIFTIIDGGLMLEGSVGLHSYHIFKP